MPEWRIYYDNGSTFGSDDGPWAEAPLDGVACIVRVDGEGTEFICGGDHYLRFDDDGTIAAIDIEPFLRSLGVVKFGRMTSNKRHEAIMRRAREDFR